ncbi:MAG TPA: TIGR03790 family protein [Acidobacteriaceae bacterium]|nr:TIGR03790 family protein [Acidobacteriaceae bacterium]
MSVIAISLRIRFLLSLLVLFSVCAAPAFAAAGSRRHSPKEVLLVYNANSPVSKAIADYYAQKRGVHNVIAIHCIDSSVSRDNETIPLADFNSEIATPIQSYLAHHKQINFIVLTRGVPIRIEGGLTGSKDEHSTGNLHPSVDSYLAAIDYPTIPGAVKISITGSGATGFGWLNRYWKATVPFSHAAFGGYLVTRLDGYTQADAIALVDRAIEAESGSLKGTVLLDVQPDFGIKDKADQPAPVTGTIYRESEWGTWNADMVKASELLQSASIPVELDMNQAFVGDRTDLLGYFSWGSNDSHYQKAAYESLRFVPGSIGDTAVSTSARTFFPTNRGQSMIADLISHGITGVKGYTNEPELQGIASPSVTLDRYFSGFNLAESLYAGSRFVGWEDVVLGDPLCCSTSKLIRQPGPRGSAARNANP